MLCSPEFGSEGHAQVRLPQAELDKHMLAIDMLNSSGYLQAAHYLSLSVVFQQSQTLSPHMLAQHVLGCSAALDSTMKAMPEEALAEREATRIGMGAAHQGMISHDRYAEEAKAAEVGRVQGHWHCSDRSR